MPMGGPKGAAHRRFGPNVPSQQRVSEGGCALRPATMPAAPADRSAAQKTGVSCEQHRAVALPLDHDLDLLRVDPK